MADGGTFATRGGSFVAEATGGLASLYSRPLDIAGEGPVDVSFTLDAQRLGAGDRLYAFALVDGERVTIDEIRRDGRRTLAVNGLTGSTLRIEIQAQAAGGRFVINDLRVATGTGEPEARPTVLRQDFSDVPVGAGAFEVDGVDRRGVIGFRSFADNLAPGGRLEVDGGRFVAEETGGVTSFYTPPIDIAGRGPVDLSVDVGVFGALSGDSRLTAFYRLDGGERRRLLLQDGPFRPTTLAATGLEGPALQLEIQATARGGGYEIDDLIVSPSASTAT